MMDSKVKTAGSNVISAMGNPRNALSSRNTEMLPEPTAMSSHTPLKANPLGLRCYFGTAWGHT